MSSQFKLMPRNKWGYDPAAVDPVIERARRQFGEPGANLIDAASLRKAAFPLVKGGYRITAVDAALDRLDDAFAQQEAQLLVEREGRAAALDHVDSIRATLVGRARRRRGKRFNRTGFFAKGYSPRKVDAMVGAVVRELESQGSLTVANLRELAFTPTWRGYNEAQVDAFIDRAVEVLQLSAALR
jgi:DivIVA domain-containing protein